MSEAESPGIVGKIGTKVFTLSLKDIVITNDRGRKQFTRLQELAESICRYGLIHPIVVAPCPDQLGKFILVAGERRYRGSILAGLVFVPAILREEASSVLAEIELEENVSRVNLTWPEECAILAKIQERKKAEDPNWGIVQTAEMTNRSTGDVSIKIKTHEKLKKRPDLKKKTEGKPFYAAVKIIEQAEEAEKVQRLAEQGQIQLTTELRHGDCRTLIKQLPDNSIDCLLTDPPYGLEKIENLRTGSQTMMSHALMSDTHNLNIEEVCEILKSLGNDIRRVMLPGSHFYMFCGFQYAGKFIDALTPFLEFQPPVVIWDRGKPSSPGYGYNYISRAECILYGYRPPRGRRLNENMYNIIECPDVPRDLRIYPTEKPVPLLITLIKNSTLPNQTVLDLFAGSASTLVAARKCGRKGIGFEVDETAYHRAQKRLIEPEESGDE